MVASGSQPTREYDFIQGDQPSYALTKAREQFAKRCEVLRANLSDPDFLENKSLGNEVGYHLFCYDSSLELEMRDFCSSLIHESEIGRIQCRIVEFNLYDIFLNICETEDLYEWACNEEAQNGLLELADSLFEMVDVDDFVDMFRRVPTFSGDVIFISGIGEVYPILRLHVLFERLQQVAIFKDLPVVAFYPGRYTGHSLSLFSHLDDGNYYRAFNLM